MSLFDVQKKEKLRKKFATEEKQKKSIYVHNVLVLSHALIIYAYDLSLMDVEIYKDILKYNRKGYVL